MLCFRNACCRIFGKPLWIFTHNLYVQLQNCWLRPYKRTRRMSTEAPRGSKLQRTTNAICGVCNEIREGISEHVDCRGCMISTFSVRNLKAKLPILKWLSKYNLEDLQGDLIAGLTVGLTVVPQGLAYAQIAELPPQYGLYSAFMGCFIYCVLGTSKDITYGPTAIMSLMTAAFARAPIPKDPTYAILLSFIGGCIQLLMGLLSLGFLVDFISYPVINSFTVAAAITIAVGQVKTLLGLKGIPREFIHQVIETCKHIPETNVYDCILGIVCMIILYILKRLKNRKWPESDSDGMCVRVFRKSIFLIGTARNALVVLVSAGFVAILMKYDINVFTLTGDIDPGLPDFKFPDFTFNKANITLTASEVFQDIGSGLAIVPIMCVVESVAIGNAFARKNNYNIDSNQELLALGIANIAGSFVSSYPVTGSFSRTAVNSQSGVRTPGGSIYTGVMVIVSLALLTHKFKYIPQAGLAGVIIMAVLDMVSFRLIPQLWRVNKPDLIPWIITFIISFLAGIEYGILAGIGVSILMLLYPWARPKVELVNFRDASTQSSDMTEIPVADQLQSFSHENLVIIQLKQGISYPGIEHIKNKLLEYPMDEENPKSVIFDCQHMANIDFTVVQGLKQLTEDFKSRGLKFILANLQADILNTIKRAKLKDVKLSDTVYEAVDTIHNDSLKEENITEPLIKEVKSDTDDTAGAAEADAVILNGIHPEGKKSLKQSDQPVYAVQYIPPPADNNDAKEHVVTQF